MKILIPIGSDFNIDERQKHLLTNGETVITINSKNSPYRTLDGWIINPNHIIKTKNVYFHQIDTGKFLLSKLCDERHQFQLNHKVNIDSFLNTMTNDGWIVDTL